MQTKYEDSHSVVVTYDEAKGAMTVTFKQGDRAIPSTQTTITANVGPDWTIEQISLDRFTRKVSP